MSTRSGLTEMVAALLEVQGGRCFHCGEEMALSGTGPIRWSREHIPPRALRGSRPSWGYVLACRGCNSKRGSVSPTAVELTRARSIWAELRSRYRHMVDDTNGRGGSRTRGPRYGAFLPRRAVATLADVWPAA